MRHLMNMGSSSNKPMMMAYSINSVCQPQTSKLANIKPGGAGLNLVFIVLLSKLSTAHQDLVASFHGG